MQLNELEMMMARLQVQQRLEQAAAERLVTMAVQVARRQRRPLTARVGRTLVRVGQRLEARDTGTWERLTAV